jgi:hypothetical protein
LSWEQSPEACCIRRGMGTETQWHRACLNLKLGANSRASQHHVAKHCITLPVYPWERGEPRAKSSQLQVWRESRK